MLITGTASGLLTDGSLPGPRGFTWGFVALEYYALILNRVMVVLFTSNNVVIIRVGDVIAAPQSVTEAHYNPLAYPTPRIANRYRSLATDSDEILKIDRVNRKVRLSDVRSARFQHRQKWGMGSVPYSGIVYLRLGENEREFILLGNQDGEHIASRVRSSLSG